MLRTGDLVKKSLQEGIGCWPGKSIMRMGKAIRWMSKLDEGLWKMDRKYVRREIAAEAQRQVGVSIGRTCKAKRLWGQSGMGETHDQSNKTVGWFSASNHLSWEHFDGICYHCTFPTQAILSPAMINDSIKSQAQILREHMEVDV